MSLNKKTYSSGDVITSTNLNEMQDAIIVNENNISTINTNINSLNTKMDNIQNTLQTITIPISKWVTDETSGYIAQFVSCDGVTSNNNIIVAPTASPITNVQAYNNNNVICCGQSLGYLTFWAKTQPTVALKVDVLILGGN